MGVSDRVGPGATFLRRLRTLSELGVIALSSVKRDFSLSGQSNYPPIVFGRRSRPTRPRFEDRLQAGKVLGVRAPHRARHERRGEGRES